MKEILGRTANEIFNNCTYISTYEHDISSALRMSTFSAEP